MKYTTIKEFNREGIEGYFNIPLNTIVERKKDGYMYYDDRKICIARSYASHQHFVLDEDNNGNIRERFIEGIKNKLDGFGNNPNGWELIFEDKIANKYRREDHQDYWLWNDNFYSAPIEDLEHIANLIGVEI